jgi:hypothetical protein
MFKLAAAVRNHFLVFPHFEPKASSGGRISAVYPGYNRARGPRRSAWPAVSYRIIKHRLAQDLNGLSGDSNGLTY